MKFFGFIGVVCLLFTQNAIAQTFAKDVAPIIYNNCSVCHRGGEIGPMSLTNYEEVKNWSQMIKQVTSSRYMPPWKPDPAYSHLLDENYLDESEIDLIADWVDAGSPYGNPSDEPDFPAFPSGSQLGEPDLVLTMAEAHLHKGNNLDSYYYFVLPNGLAEDQMVKAIELRPGNPEIVHHCLFFEDNTGRLQSIDDETPEYGFDGFGDFGIEQILNNKQYPGYVPGTKPRYFPDGQGQVMTAGADLVIQMHYAPSPIDAWDQSSVNIFFADEEEVVDREVKDHIMLPFPNVIGELFFIPANQEKAFHGIWSPVTNVSLMGISPHMHYLGTSWEVYIEHQDGGRTNLISIPVWDFNWQGAYYFDRLHVVKKGDEVHAIATYDNTVDNPSNPNFPPINVQWGERTQDEMYYLPLMYLDYEMGDENVRYDAEPTASEELDPMVEAIQASVYPNPVVQGGDVFIPFSLEEASTLQIEILDSSGKRIRKLRGGEFYKKGQHQITLNTFNLEEGLYFVNMKSGVNRATVSFVIH